MNAWMKWSTLAAALAVTPSMGAPAAKKLPQAGRKEPALAAPSYLSAELREVLNQKMSHHAQNMHALVFAVLLLDRDSARAIAHDIAAEPRLARPLPGGDDTLNALLPKRFFVLQDDLRQRATEVAEAAGQKDDVKLAESFGRMTSACVACHSVYLQGNDD